MDIFLNNTLTGTKDQFKPLKKGRVLMYHCGPTVYNFPTIGNMRSYIFADILRRFFEYSGFEVKQVINITDVGHLIGDGDDGDDKIEKEAEKAGKSATEITRFYETVFYKDLQELNIETKNTKFPRASEHIPEQIEIIKILEEKGFTYTTSDGIYFNTAKFPDYGKLGNINLEGQEAGARIGINNEKKNKTDFALWKLSSEKKRLQEWESPWGIGFPGWHLECSAMSRKYLGQPFDVHTGGIDHIAVHHNNEIAQSEAAFEAPLAKYWLHNEFLLVEGEKMSKSLGNIFTLEDLKQRKVHPLSFRYLLLSSKYSSPMNFTWEGVQGAQNALENIVTKYNELVEAKVTSSLHDDGLKQFEEAMMDDLNTPIAIAVLQKASHRITIDKMDLVLGLDIKKLSENLRKIPEEILQIKEERDQARLEKNWQKSDKLREEIESQGYVLEDTEEVSKIRRTLASLTSSGLASPKL